MKLTSEKLQLNQIWKINPSCNTGKRSLKLKIHVELFVCVQVNNAVRKYEIALFDE